MKRAVLGPLLGLGLVACVSGNPDVPDAGPTPFVVVGTLVPAAAEASLPAGPSQDGLSAILPGGRKITPTGTQIVVTGFPIGMRVLGGGKHILVTDAGIYDEYLSLIDTSTNTVVQTFKYGASDGKALFLGLAVRADGHIFVSGGGSNVISEYTYDPSPPVGTLPMAFARDLPLNPGGTTSSNYVAGIAFIDATHLVVAAQLSNEVLVMDTTDGSRVGVPVVASAPYDVVVDGQKAWVSEWSADAVLELDVSSGTPMVTGSISVGKNPEALLLLPAGAPTKLLVANSDSDSVSVIDLSASTHVVTDTIAAAVSTHPQRGSTPNHLSVSPDGASLYVANAGENCVDVFATSDWHRVGRVPTAWYPTATVSLPDGTLYVANAKGMGDGPYQGGGGDNTTMKGTVSAVPVSELTSPALASGETQVDANEMRPVATGPTVTCPAAGDCWPLPPQAGMRTPIEHIILIVRENKTYDANLGDLGTDASGDPTLVEWGENVTPNLHALARAFTNGDNFYSNAEASIQGHEWMTAGTSNDYTEKAWLTGWGRGYRPTTNFSNSLSSPERGYYFQHLGRAGIDYIDYGEIIGVAGNLMPGDPTLNIDVGWPGGVVFNLNSKDVLKAQYFKKQVQTYDFLPHFNYVLLPNNHTNGLQQGSWTPEYMISDNDEGTGQVVDAITHSRFWPTSIIFIVEDDPSDGYDHVEAHRSTLVVVSPWVKRHHTEHVHYDVPSMWRTIEVLLGLPPESQETASASPMYDIFATEPDYTPYDYIPGKVPEAKNTKSRLGDLSAKLDFSAVDRAPGLGRLLWEHVKGTPPPRPPRPEEMGFERERKKFPVFGGSTPPKPAAGVGRPAGAGVDDDDDDD